MFRKSVHISELSDINKYDEGNLSSLPDDEVRRLADALVKAKPNFNELSQQELFIIICSLPLDQNSEVPNLAREEYRKKEIGFGVEFLKMLLDTHGTSKVGDFATQANAALKEEHRLAPYHFDDKSKKVFDAARRRYVSKFGLFWASVGTGVMAVGIPRTAVDGMNLMLGDEKSGAAEMPKPALSPDACTADKLRHIRETAKHVDQKMSPFSNEVDLAIGGGLATDGVILIRNKAKGQLKPVAEAVLTLGKRYPELLGLSAKLPFVVTRTDEVKRDHHRFRQRATGQSIEPQER